VSALSAPTPTFSLPISSGILAHCQRIGIALWVFLWMIDRTTKEVPTTDGYADGLVYDGKAISAHVIATDLGMKTRTVHSHIELLVAAGYLRRIDHGVGMPSGYTVVRSKKWKNPRRKTAGGSLNPARPAPNSALPSQNSAPYKEDNTRTLQGLSIAEEKYPSRPSMESGCMRAIKNKIDL